MTNDDPLQHEVRLGHRHAEVLQLNVLLLELLPVQLEHLGDFTLWSHMS